MSKIIGVTESGRIRLYRCIIDNTEYIKLVGDDGIQILIEDVEFINMIKIYLNAEKSLIM